MVISTYRLFTTALSFILIIVGLIGYKIATKNSAKRKDTEYYESMKEREREEARRLQEERELDSYYMESKSDFN